MTDAAPHHGPNPEDQALARSVARRLLPRAADMTDAELDSDAIVEWVSCLFRKVRDEALPKASDPNLLNDSERIEGREP